MQVILDLFTELYEKQDILSKLTQSSSLQGYGSVSYTHLDVYKRQL